MQNSQTEYCLQNFKNSNESVISVIESNLLNYVQQQILLKNRLVKHFTIPCAHIYWVLKLLSFENKTKQNNNKRRQREIQTKCVHSFYYHFE